MLDIVVADRLRRRPGIHRILGDYEKNRPCDLRVFFNPHDNNTCYHLVCTNLVDSLVQPQSACNYDVMHSVVLRYILCPGICQY